MPQPNYDTPEETADRLMEREMEGWGSRLIRWLFWPLKYILSAIVFLYLWGVLSDAKSNEVIAFLGLAAVTLLAGIWGETRRTRKASEASFRRLDFIWKNEGWQEQGRHNEYYED